ncbi:short chain dehydrogenase [Tetragenococcus halophilus subsp. flandriensis]|uniref:SDR family oxidoreductase n=1 Tax=Tetragenococcus halophilus TaxID=51669 RepID=UPI0023E91AC5|nr:SDR family oxidoreductase [Tetragenococcus halophilus]GMA07732.1 short chain dehydrogenase [Tetragenococcus halophilus subsp. flandriensis]
MELNGKKIVIVGGSSGIGLASAKKAVDQGAEVIIVSRSSEKLAEAKQEIGKDITSYTADMTKENEMEDLFAEIGTFDHLVVTAGTATYGNFLDTEVSEARALFDNKFWGQYIAVKYGVPRLSEEGSVTLFSGVVAFKAMVGSAALGAVNASIANLGQTLALELAPIRVNVVSPGIIDTPSRYGMPEVERKEFYQDMAEQLPLKRVGQADDVADSVIYLMKNSFVTGEIVHNEGGHRLI